MQADGDYIFLCDDNSHWKCRIKDRLVLIRLLLRRRIVNDHEGLSLLALDTGAFFLIERGTHEIRLDSEVSGQKRDFPFGRADRRDPAPRFRSVNPQNAVVYCLVKIQHRKPLSSRGSSLGGSSP